jgi:hypothetical protein
MAGLVGCLVRRPPQAAPPSWRVRPPASIALDRGQGGTAALAVTLSVTIPRRSTRILVLQGC